VKTSLGQKGASGSRPGRRRTNLDELQLLSGGRFGQAPRTCRRCHLLRAIQEPVSDTLSHDFGPDGKRLRRNASGKDQAGGPGGKQRVLTRTDLGLQSSYTVEAVAEDWLSGRPARTIQLSR
jgi:hypothetical protein